MSDTVKNYATPGAVALFIVYEIFSPQINETTNQQNDMNAGLATLTAQVTNVRRDIERLEGKIDEVDGSTRDRLTGSEFDEWTARHREFHRVSDSLLDSHESRLRGLEQIVSESDQ